MSSPSIVGYLDSDGNVGSTLASPAEVNLQIINLLWQPEVVEVIVSTIPEGSNVCYESKFSRDPVLGAMFPIMYMGGWYRDSYTFPASQL